MKKVLDGKKAYEAYFKDLEAKYNKLEVKPCIAIIHDNNSNTRLNFKFIIF